jgi:hypothetical protein
MSGSNDYTWAEIIYMFDYGFSDINNPRYISRRTRPPGDFVALEQSEMSYEGFFDYEYEEELIRYLCPELFLEG